LKIYAAAAVYTWIRPAVFTGWQAGEGDFNAGRFYTDPRAGDADGFIGGGRLFFECSV
jgi:hypothetical protein